MRRHYIPKVGGGERGLGIAQSGGLATIGEGQVSSPGIATNSRLTDSLGLVHSHALTILFYHEISHVLLGHMDSAIKNESPIGQVR